MSDSTPPGEPSGTSAMLLDAVMALSSDLDLHGVLTRIVESAMALTDARYGALGVLGPDGSLGEFVTSGLTHDQHDRIGEPPHGRGILGLLISDAQPLRLTDLSRHPASYGFPKHHPAMSSFLGVPVHIRGTVFGNLYLTEKAGAGDFTESDERLVVALANAAGLVIENARAYGLSERRRQWLEAAAALTDALQPPVGPDRAAQEVCASARRLGGAWAVGVVSADGTRDVRALDCDPRLEARAQDLMEQIGTGDGEAVDLDVEGLVATLVPLPVRLAEGGTLVALYDPETARRREPDERELLISFAEHAALTLDRATAVRDHEQLAVLSDRHRIARDLHDTVIQRLFAVGMQLQAVALVEGDELGARLRSSVEAVDETIRDIRATIFDLQSQREAKDLD